MKLNITRKKAAEILLHLPEAFEEIQDRKLIDQGNGHASVMQPKVLKHYGLNSDIKEAVKDFRKSNGHGKRYSNECMCFGAHMHVELWFASLKACKQAAPRCLNAVKSGDNEPLDLTWSYSRGKELLHTMLLKFPVYHKYGVKKGYIVKGESISTSMLKNFLADECGAPENCFSAVDWPKGITPSKVLKKLNKVLDVKAVLNAPAE